MKLLLAFLFLYSGFAYAQKDTVYTSFVDAFQQPDSVYQLDLSQKGLKEIPNAISLFPNLEVLIFTENAITELPDVVCSITKLKKLDLGHNYLTSIPSEIAHLKNLEFLGLSWNYTLDESIKNVGELKQLKVLKLDGLKIKKLPKTFSNLLQLEEIDLSYNKFKKIPKVVFMLRQLKSLTLIRNYVPIEIDSKIAELELLEFFIWAYNNSFSLSDKLNTMENLVYLNLEGNKFDQQEIDNLISSYSNIKNVIIEF